MNYYEPPELTDEEIKQLKEEVMSEKESFTTPKVVFKYPFTVRKDVPDSPKIKPKYKITAVFDPKNNPEHKKRLKEINDLVTDKSLKVGEKYHPIKEDTEKDDDGNRIKTGKYAITFKTDYPFDTYDSKNRVIHREENFIANGSEGYISWSYDYYEEGRVTLYLNAVQITKLIEWEGRNADSFGFTEQEDGYDGGGTPFDENVDGKPGSDITEGDPLPEGVEEKPSIEEEPDWLND